MGHRNEKISTTCTICGVIFHPMYGREEKTVACSNKCNGAHQSKMRLRTIEEKFWEKVITNDGCWSWAGQKRKDGYAIVSHGKIGHVRAHRISYEIHKGKIPDGLMVRHDCDNPECTNPDHLRLGTAKDNIRDCISRGRFKVNRVIGEAHPNSKITPDTALEIRQLNGSPESIAKRYGVSRQTVHRIRTGKSWAHI